MAQWSSEELSYCSNVHHGDTLAEVKSNICRFISPVRVNCGLAQLQSGLWLSQRAANELLKSEDEQLIFADLLREKGINLLSLNGFPYGDFHADVVKENVYLPHWGDGARLHYTTCLAELLAKFMPEGSAEATISTVPLGFSKNWSELDQQNAEYQLCELLTYLITLEESSGKSIRVCLEMEPGCVLETTPQLLRFFSQSLPKALQKYGLPKKAIDKHLGVCFDICHQAVMFENISQSLSAIHDAGIVIGKIQISSALKVTYPLQAKSLLELYAEPRYLHQLSYLDEHNEQQFCIDLVKALSDPLVTWQNEWRIHYHVPIQAEQLDSPLLMTTREAILETCQFLVDHPNCKPHLEVETYTWGVMPEALQPNDDEQLIDAIAKELTWLKSTLTRFKLMSTLK